MREIKKSDQQLGGLDTLFLKVEHPRRLMTVTSIWTFKQRLDQKQVYKVLERLCEEYPRFAKTPAHEGFFRPATWIEPAGWSFQDNIVNHTLKEPTKKALQKYCAEQVVTPFDYTKPLWELHAISGLENGHYAFFWKAHHALADGEGFIRSLLSTTSLGSTLKKLEEQSVVSHRRKKDIIAADKKRSSDTDTDRPKSSLQKAFAYISAMVNLLWLVLYQIYVYSVVTIHDLYCVLLCILPVTRKDLYYKGLQSHDKEMAWSKDVSIKDIKFVREAFGGTLNDVMLLVITRCLKGYLESIGKRSDNYISFIIPVSLREPSDWSFQNVVSGSWGFFSMNDLDTKQLLRQVKTEMLAIKNSFGPRMLYEIWQWFFGHAPGLSPPMSVYNHICDIPHGVFTNVPGPTVPIDFAGEEIQEYRTFPPQCGKGSIGMALISYSGKVSIGAIADVHRDYPQVANGVCSRFADEFQLVLDEARMETSKKNANLKLHKKE
ncbi:wax ester synthase-like acyl-CoA acyltransferase domain-containing protein [Parasitella parasitica]|nr:wax ester synthase-like acyl-CoA acyltransferase domain-containing protein [Parasitella parasitica]